VTGYIASRLVTSCAMVVLASLVVFLIANTVPGDPVLAQLRDLAARQSRPSSPPSAATAGASICHLGALLGVPAAVSCTATSASRSPPTAR
jgi:ABC-type dipeptide/oligopeptide/nickel transport system permease component